MQSLNTRADFVTKGTFFGGLDSYGQIMIGDKAFEYYNDHNVNHCVQIPWTEVEYVAAAVYLKGRWIPRFMIRTKDGAAYTFAAREPRKLLSMMQPYVPADKLVRSLTFAQAVRRRFSRPRQSSAETESE